MRRSVGVSLRFDDSDEEGMCVCGSLRLPRFSCLHAISALSLYINDGLFGATAIEIVEETVKMVNVKRLPPISIGKPKAIIPVDAKRDAEKKLTGRSCSATKIIQPVRCQANKKTPFSEEETRAILHGHVRFHDAWNKWARIRDHFWVFNRPENVSRSSVQIKDRYRTMAQSDLIQFDKNENIILQGIKEPESTAAAKLRLGRNCTY